MKNKINLGLLVLISGALIAGCGSKGGGSGVDTTGKNMLPSKTAPSNCADNGDETCTVYKTGKFKVANATVFNKSFLGNSSSSSGGDNVGEAVAIESPWTEDGWNLKGTGGSLMTNGINCVGLPLALSWFEKLLGNDDPEVRGCDTDALYGDDDGWGDDDGFGSDFAAASSGSTIYAEIQWVYNKEGAKQLVGAIVTVDAETKTYKSLNGSRTMFVDSKKRTGIQITSTYVRMISGSNANMGRFY